MQQIKSLTRNQTSGRIHQCVFNHLIDINRCTHSWDHKYEPERGIYVHRLKQQPKVVGTKQTAKVLEQKQASVVYIAKDADPRVTQKIRELADEQGIPIVMVDTMKLLGESCQVEVRTATAAIVK